MNRLKIKSIENRLVSAVCTILVPISILAICTRSNAGALSAIIDWVSTDDLSKIQLRVGSTIQAATPGKRLTNRNHALYVDKNGPYAHLGFIGSPSNMYVKVGPQGAKALFRWRCNIPGSGSFTVGYEAFTTSDGRDEGCRYGAPGSSWASLLPLDTLDARVTQKSNDHVAQTVTPVQGNQEFITVARATKAITLYQARYVGKALEIDVVAGSITITTPNGQQQVEAGSRYTYRYFSQSKGQISNKINPDQKAIDSFLDPNQWTSFSEQIKKLQQALSAKPEPLTPIAQEILDAHNKWRSQVNVPPLRWSKKLADYAQEWANNLSTQGKLEHREGGPSGAGENLVAGPDSVTDMVNRWGSEGQDYDHATNSCRSGRTCGHYTQVVWKNTTELGCGVAPIRRYGRVLVCNYSPPGNYIGQPPY